MLTVAQVVAELEKLAPVSLACDWDNVGLQVGDPTAEVRTVMVALTATGEVIKAACEHGVNLVVTHHPLLFHPIKAIRFDQPFGRAIQKLITENIGVYSLHTNLDVAVDGLNDWLAARLSLRSVVPLTAHASEGEEESTGLGRLGELPECITLEGFCRLVKGALEVPRVRVTGDPKQLVKRVAVCGGDGGRELLSHALSVNSDVLLTGDVKYHTAIDALEHGIAVVDAGHFATERLAALYLADYLRSSFRNTNLGVIVAVENDPFRYI